MSAHDLLTMTGAVLVARLGTQLLAALLKLPAYAVRCAKA